MISGRNPGPISPTNESDTLLKTISTNFVTWLTNLRGLPFLSHLQGDTSDKSAPDVANRNKLKDG